MRNFHAALRDTLGVTIAEPSCRAACSLPCSSRRNLTRSSSIATKERKGHKKDRAGEGGGSDDSNIGRSERKFGLVFKVGFRTHSQPKLHGFPHF